MTRLLSALAFVLLSVVPASAQTGGWVWQNNGSTLTTTTPSGAYYAVDIWNKNNSGCAFRLRSGSGGTEVMKVCGTTVTISGTLTPSGSINLSSGQCFSVNSDTFLGRISAGVFGVGTSCGGVQGTVSAASVVSPLFRASAASILTLSTDGKLLATNSAATAGVTLDFATDSTLKLFARNGSSNASLYVSGGITTNTGQAFRWPLGTQLVSSGDGTFRAINDANSAGVLFNIATDSVFWVKTRGDADTATVKANTGTFAAYNFNGTTGKTGTACTAFEVGGCTAATEPLDAYNLLWRPLVQDQLQPYVDRIASLEAQVQSLSLQVQTLMNAIRK